MLRWPSSGEVGTHPFQPSAEGFAIDGSQDDKKMCVFHVEEPDFSTSRKKERKACFLTFTTRKSPWILQMQVFASKIPQPVT